MIKWKNTTYPSTFIGLSDELAKVRGMLSADVYNKNVSKNRNMSSRFKKLDTMIIEKHIKEICG